MHEKTALTNCPFVKTSWPGVSPGVSPIVGESSKREWKITVSRGVLRRDMNPSQIALEYQEGGASAISVLTDEKFFHGKLAHLEAVRRALKLPLLRKDFS